MHEVIKMAFGEILKVKIEMITDNKQVATNGLTELRIQTSNAAAYNGRFGASGGVARPTLCVEQLLPLSSKPQWNPPPVAKPLGR